MVEEQKPDQEVIKCKNDRRMSRKRLSLFKLREDGGLLWNSLEVPILQQLEDVLQTALYRDDG